MRTVTRITATRPLRLLIATLAVAVAAVAPCAGAPLTLEVQKQVQAATFEVVTKKPAKESVTYEKPLPLELIPFVERNDAYWSVGTAFAIGPNTFVTAGHVIMVGVGSQFGTLAVRDSSGKVYDVDRILKYAQNQDFAVFTVRDAPAVIPLQTGSAPAVDEPVFAAGNALGEGVVIRDGLLTSLTPEAQDGKWKWLRFSAAASPGNSGGPLLDGAGKVVGVVIAKSPNENLNYALPIEEVLKGSDKAAVFDKRQSFGIPKLLQGSIVGEFKDSFPLPLSYSEFARNFRAVILKYFEAQRTKLFAAEAADLFPRNSAKFLASLYQSFDPTIVAQGEDRTWDAPKCDGSEIPLPEDGRVWHCNYHNVLQLFRIQFPGGGLDERRYSDSKAFMDLLLKGINTPRMVGSEAIRITSLGPALQDSVFRDHFGRPWQLRAWSLGFADAYVLVVALPTPDGYVGLIAITPSVLLDTTTEFTKVFADYVYLTYTGSLPQWRAFLDRRDLLPTSFEHIKLQNDQKGMRFESPRLQLDDSGGLLPLGAQSTLDLQMTYMVDRDKLTWDVGGIVLAQNHDRKTWLAAYRRPPPAADAGKDARERWEHMNKRDGDFSGVARHNDQYTTFWVRTVASGPSNPGSAGDSRPLYEVVYNTDSKVLPRQMEDIQTNLLKDLRVME